MSSNCSHCSKCPKGIITTSIFDCKQQDKTKGQIEYKNIPSVNTQDNVDKKEYLEKRKKWLERDAAIGNTLCIELSKKEQLLDKYIKALIYQEQQNFYITFGFPPTRQFIRAKPAIEASPLFPLLQSMPKGGLLHLHAAASGDMGFWLHQLASYDSVYIYTGPDTPENVYGYSALFFAGQTPDPGYVSLQSLVASNPPGYIENTLVPIYVMTKDTVKSWDKANFFFTAIFGFWTLMPAYLTYLKQGMETIIADNINYLDLRIDLPPAYYDANGNPYTDQQAIQLFINLIEEVKQEHPKFDARLILEWPRYVDRPTMLFFVETSFQMKQLFPKYIIGFDLVTQEDAGNKTIYYLDDLLTQAEAFSKQYGVTLRYFFHDGESDWGSNRNLYDAILLKTTRIGHGFNLLNFPYLQEQVKCKNICLEACPISNQSLGFCSDLRIHPATGYLKQGLPITINNDDSCFFTNSGLSYDFW